jgi:hypothetical protein
VTLAAVLLLTLYGPFGLTRLSVNSQARRLARTLEPSAPTEEREREASAALRFLIDHNAGEAIARAIGREIPPVDWASVPRYGTERDSLARMVMELAGARYVPEYGSQPDGWFHLNSGGPIRVTGYAWAVQVGANDPSAHVLDGDTVQVVAQGGIGTVRVRVDRDTLVFDLRPVVERYADSALTRAGTMVGRIEVEAAGETRRAALVLTNLSGQRAGDSLATVYWSGTLLLGE